MSSAADSYYTRTRRVPSGRNALVGAIDTDVCVVGGGLAGLATATELVRRGRRVALLEARCVGWGASGRNGGIVCPGYSLGLESLEGRVGVEAAAALYRLSMEGVDIVRRNLGASPAPDLGVQHGLLATVRYAPGDGLRRHRDRMASAFGRELELLSAEQLRQKLCTNRYRGGLLDAQALQIHPLKYALSLAGGLRDAGGVVFEDTPALRLTHGRSAKTVHTAEGRVRCRDVVVASGGYADGLIPVLRRSVLPIATYVMVTEPDADRAASAIRTRAAVSDDRRAGDYYRLVDDGRRILWGGCITTRTTPPRRLADRLHRSMASTYPQLAGLGVDRAWSGLMAYARHWMPIIGPLDPGVWVCSGFGGHGINATAIGGRVMAEAITGETSRYRQFEPFGLRWNGGVVGRAAAQATYWWLGACDWLREHRG